MSDPDHVRFQGLVLEKTSLNLAMEIHPANIQFLLESERGMDSFCEMLRAKLVVQLYHTPPREEVVGTVRYPFNWKEGIREEIWNWWDAPRKIKRRYDLVIRVLGRLCWLARHKPRPCRYVDFEIRKKVYRVCPHVHYAVPPSFNPDRLHLAWMNENTLAGQPMIDLPEGVWERMWNRMRGWYMDRAGNLRDGLKNKVPLYTLAEVMDDIEDQGIRRLLG